MRFCVVQIWIVRVLKNTPDLHSAYFGYLGRTMQGPTVPLLNITIMINQFR